MDNSQLSEAQIRERLGSYVPDIPGSTQPIFQYSPNGEVRGGNYTSYNKKCNVFVYTKLAKMLRFYKSGSKLTWFYVRMGITDDDALVDAELQACLHNNEIGFLTSNIFPEYEYSAMWSCAGEDSRVFIYNNGLYYDFRSNWRTTSKSELFSIVVDTLDNPISESPTIPTPPPVPILQSIPMLPLIAGAVGIVGLVFILILNRKT